MERVRRVELPTLCLASIRSSQLSYTRMLINYSNRQALSISVLSISGLTVSCPSLPQSEKLDMVTDS
jgi:hypothetical protein